MSNLPFHNKLHRKIHHTEPTEGFPDSATDPIASIVYPFYGGFYNVFLLANNELVKTNSYDWHGYYTKVYSSSAFWELNPSVRTTTSSLCSNWNLAYNPFYLTYFANSAKYESVYTNVFYNSAATRLEDLRAVSIYLNTNDIISNFNSVSSIKFEVFGENNFEILSANQDIKFVVNKEIAGILPGNYVLRLSGSDLDLDGNVYYSFYTPFIRINTDSISRVKVEDQILLTFNNTNSVGYGVVYLDETMYLNKVQENTRAKIAVPITLEEDSNRAYTWHLSSQTAFINLSSSLTCSLCSPIDPRRGGKYTLWVQVDSCPTENTNLVFSNKYKFQDNIQNNNVMWLSAATITRIDFLYDGQFMLGKVTNYYININQNSGVYYQGLGLKFSPDPIELDETGSPLNVQRGIKFDINSTSPTYTYINAGSGLLKFSLGFGLRTIRLYGYGMDWYPTAPGPWQPYVPALTASFDKATLWKQWNILDQPQVYTNLSNYTGAAAAYSLRKLFSSYSGNAIKIRRSSDNALLDIGFDGNGNLNESAISTHCGGSYGYIDTWYDQSGNSYHATVSSIFSTPTTRDPMIYDPAVGVLKSNNRATVRFISGGRFLAADSTKTVDFASKNIYIVHSSYTTPDTFGGGPRLISKRSTDVLLNYNNSYKAQWGAALQYEGASSYTVGTSSLSLLDVAWDGVVSPDRIALFRDGYSVSVSTYTPHVSSPTNEFPTQPCTGGTNCTATAARTANNNNSALIIGNSVGQAGIRWWDGNISEVVIYNNIQYSTNNIKQSIMWYYNIISALTPATSALLITPLSSSDLYPNGDIYIPGSIYHIGPSRTFQLSSCQFVGFDFFSARNKTIENIYVNKSPIRLVARKNNGFKQPYTSNNERAVSFYVEKLSRDLLFEIYYAESPPFSLASRTASSPDPADIVKIPFWLDAQDSIVYKFNTPLISNNLGLIHSALINKGSDYKTLSSNNLSPILKRAEVPSNFTSYGDYYRHAISFSTNSLLSASFVPFLSATPTVYNVSTFTAFMVKTNHGTNTRTVINYGNAQEGFSIRVMPNANTSSLTAELQIGFYSSSNDRILPENCITLFVPKNQKIIIGTFRASNNNYGAFYVVDSPPFNFYDFLGPYDPVRSPYNVGSRFRQSFNNPLTGYSGVGFNYRLVGSSYTPGNYFDGEIYEALVTNGRLTSPMFRGIISYLYQKWIE